MSSSRSQISESRLTSSNAGFCSPLIANHRAASTLRDINGGSRGSPVQPFPRLSFPDGQGTLGLERSASHPAVTGGACERGNGLRTLIRGQHMSPSFVAFPLNVCDFVSHLELAEAALDDVAAPAPLPLLVTEVDRAARSLERWAIWWSAFQFPNRSGRSRHGAPVRNRHAVASTTVRRSTGGRPVAFTAGNRGPSTTHASSEITSRDTSTRLRPTTSNPLATRSEADRDSLPAHTTKRLLVRRDR